MINIKYDLNTINNKREQVKKSLFKMSNTIKSEDFIAISNNDLYILFKLYDEIFLNDWFKDNFKGNINFVLSRQLTKAAGNTRTKKNIVKLKPEEIEFEVKISLNHLINFDKIDRDKTVGGINVNNKLDSLMLVLEHELCHVIEFIVCYKSSCSKEPFKNLIYDVFGQKESTHNLISYKEVTLSEYGLKMGDNVKFQFKEKEISGFINRINKNAIVMCPSPRGKYVDKAGNFYTKYSVPLSCLQKI